MLASGTKHGSRAEHTADTMGLGTGENMMVEGAREPKMAPSTAACAWQGDVERPFGTSVKRQGTRDMKPVAWRRGTARGRGNTDPWCQDANMLERRPKRPPK